MHEISPTPQEPVDEASPQALITDRVVHAIAVSHRLKSKAASVSASFLMVADPTVICGDRCGEKKYRPIPSKISIANPQQFLPLPEAAPLTTACI